MKNNEGKCFKFLNIASNHFLLFIFSIASVSLMSCGDDAVDLPREIEIIGGHQVEVTDSILNFKYGLFNEQGLPATEFKEGEPILFSFWVTNTSNESLRLDNSEKEYTDFFRVYKLEKLGTRIDMGKPHKAMFFNKIRGLDLRPNDPIKFELPWIVPKDFSWSSFLWAGMRESTPPLEKGTYQTKFAQTFRTLPDINGEKEYVTDVLSFEIDFQVK